VRDKPVRVRHAEVYGTREEKYAGLAKYSVQTTKWQALDPQAPFYLFVPQDKSVRAEYDQGWKITDAMPVNVLGFQTHRDDFAIDFEEDVLRRRIVAMRHDELSDAEFAQEYGVQDNRDWKLALARKNLRENSSWKSHLIPCSYRPFDTRWAYFDEVAKDYPRRELKENVAGKDNLCLGVGRQGIAVQDDVWSLLTCSTTPIDANIFRRGGVNIFPLYLYTDSKSDLFDEAAEGKRHPNLSREFIADFSARLQLAFVSEGCGDLRKTFGPEDVFRYVYAVFSAPSFRIRYAEFLKIDFPRLPLVSDRKLFGELCSLGAQLIDVHLMKTIPKLETRYPVAGDNRMENLRYDEPNGDAPGRVWINARQYFDNVPPHVWGYHIGGFQVCHKWLKDRKGRQLSYDELTHYRGIVSVLARTMELQGEIDEAIGEWPLG
jgi:predicted helicase